jgi:hypothetical protein
MVRKMQVIGQRRRLRVGLVALGLIVAALIAFGDSSSSQPDKWPGIEPLFAGIPQHGAVLGDPGAPVTLQFFGDLECPEARQVILGVMPLLIHKWVRGGELRIVYRAHQEETTWSGIYDNQEVAALAAGEQGKAWQYLDLFYHEQRTEFTRYATNHFLQAIAKEVPDLDFTRWTEARREPRLTEEVKHDGQVAEGRWISQTPAFLIGPTGGAAKPLLHFTFTETPAFDEVIERLLSA